MHADSFKTEPSIITRLKQLVQTMKNLLYTPKKFVISFM